MSSRVNKMAVLRDAFNHEMVNNQMMVREAVANASSFRSTLLSKLIDERRDIDDECGYPKELTIEQYKLMYDREGIATRVVNLYPEECWNLDPEIKEDDGADETEFEKAWKDLEKERQLYTYMATADEISGIGKFGVLFLGLDDGLELDQPVEGINERGEKVGNVQHKLNYVRVFDESCVCIKELEADRTNPRYGKPVYYSIKFEEISVPRRDTGEAVSTTTRESRVHWSRIIHIADNRKNSEIYGTPRLQVLFNRLYDIRKIAGGSGEMFWKGGFPGTIFSLDSTARPLTEAQKAAFKDELAAYANGLQRYLTTQGITAETPNVQLADPKNHIEIQILICSIALSCPKRVFQGSEESKLAASQDSKAWNKRVNRRREKHVSPIIIEPLINRLIMFGVLPEPKQYTVCWPDLDSPTKMDKTEILSKQVEALSKYISGNVDQLIPPKIFLSMFMEMESDQIDEIMDAVIEREKEMEDEEEIEPPVPTEEIKTKEEIQEDDNI